jgi:DNA mismatch endonuclease (patch repair protein)
MAYEPKSNIAFWAKKFASNVARDENVLAELKNRGWDTMVIWECEVKDPELVTSRLSAYLGRADDK